MFGSNDKKGIYFSPESSGGGGTETQQQQQEQQQQEQDPHKEAKELLTTNTGLKSYIDSLITEAITKTSEEISTKTKGEVLAQVEKEKKTSDLKAKKEKALADGDAAETTRLEREQIEADKQEAKALREEAKAYKDEATKVRIANKYKLPPGTEKRLLGTSEAEWEEDAKELQKLTNTQHRTADTEGGSRGTPSSKQEAEASAKRAVKSAISMF